jgi:hypothetical protein
MKLGCILQISSETVGNFPEALKFDQLAFKLDWFICTQQQLVLPVQLGGGQVI